jgi:hypothetical protein
MACPVSCIFLCVASARAFLVFFINLKRVARAGKARVTSRARFLARSGKARVTPVRAFLKPETRLNSIKGRCGSCARFHGVFLLT